jgi:hypothetical protein
MEEDMIDGVDMDDDPICDLEGHLEEDEQLFLLPVTGVNTEAPFEVSDTAILYGKGMIDYYRQRIVSFPQYEWSQYMRRPEVVKEKSITLRGLEKSWFASAATQVTREEFFACAILAFPFKIDMEKFLTAHSHVTHMRMMKAAVEEAERHWKSIDPAELPGAKLANFCKLPRSVFSAAMLYSPYYKESYIFAGKIEDATLLKEPKFDTGDLKFSWK